MMGNRVSYLGILQIPDKRGRSKLHGISYLELKALSCKLTRNHSGQQGLIQEMYLCLLTSPPARTKSWYRQHCYYRGIDYIRHSNHHFISLEEQYPKQTMEESSFEIHNRIEQRDRLNQIKEKASQVLNPKELLIFKYYFIEGKNSKRDCPEIRLNQSLDIKKIKKLCTKSLAHSLYIVERIKLGSQFSGIKDKLLQSYIIVISRSTKGGGEDLKIGGFKNRFGDRIIHITKIKETRRC